MSHFQRPKNGLAMCVCVCVCVLEALQKSLRPFNSAKQSFPFTTGPGIVDKSFVVNLFKMIVEQTMDEPVTNGSYGNFPALIVTDDKFFVASVTVCAVIQITTKLKKVFLEMILKIVKFQGLPLSFFKFKPDFPNIF